MVVVNTFTAPAEGIVHQQTSTKLYVNEREIGTGTLYITESQLSWCDLLKCVGFSMRYPNICLHAVRREPYPSLYVMLDYKLQLPEGLIPAEDTTQQIDEPSSDDEENEDDHELTELMFAPNDQDMLQRMFSAMSECQALHPDPNDEVEDSDEYDPASVMLDDDLFEPPLQNAEEYMQGLHIGVNNGHNTEDSPGEGIEEMEHDPDQFADD